MKIFTDSEIGKGAGIPQVARDLSVAAKSIKQRLQAQLTATGPSADMYMIPDEDDDPSNPALDFRLSTSLGQVYTRFDLVRDDQMIFGQYAFLLQERDACNKVTFKPVFSILFNGQGRYLFGDTLRPGEPNRGFQEIDTDFGWRLSGNILLSIYNQLSSVRNSGFDIETLAVDSK
jgi:hypothetical protein